jgi:type IV pilus assembly protein PilX
MSSAKNIMHRKNQSGFVLIASMLMLIVLAFMAVGMYHSFTTQENMSSNIKEKGRTFQMAQSTLQFAEYNLLNSGLNINTTDCTQLPANNQVFNVCDNISSNIVKVSPPTATTPWSIGAQGNPQASVQYNPTTEDSNISITSTAAGQNTFSTNPLFYVQYMGTGTSSSCPSSAPKLYQVTAIAYGASNTTAAVVQSIYQLVPTVCNLGSS